MLKRGVTDTIQETCSCNFTLSNLEKFETACSADSNTLTLNTTVVYASESGNTTASTLIQMFQDKAASTSVMISFSSHTAAVRRVCSPSCTTDTQPGTSSTPEPQVEGPNPTSTPQPQAEQPSPSTTPAPKVDQPIPVCTPKPQVEELNPSIMPEPQMEEPNSTCTAEPQKEASVITLLGVFLGGLFTGVVSLVITACIVR